MSLIERSIRESVRTLSSVVYDAYIWSSIIEVQLEVPNGQGGKVLHKGGTTAMLVGMNAFREITNVIKPTRANAKLMISKAAELQNVLCNGTADDAFIMGISSDELELYGEDRGITISYCIRGDDLYPFKVELK